LYYFHQFTLPLHALYLNNYLGDKTVPLHTMHMCYSFLCISFIQLIQPSMRSFIMCIMFQLLFSSSIQRNISNLYVYVYV